MTGIQHKRPNFVTQTYHNMAFMLLQMELGRLS